MIEISRIGPAGRFEGGWTFERLAAAIATALLEDEVTGPALRGGGEAKVTLKPQGTGASPSCAILAYDKDDALKVADARTYRIVGRLVKACRYHPPAFGAVIAIATPRSATLRAALAAKPAYDAEGGARDYEAAVRAMPKEKKP